MQNSFINIETISELHQYFNYPAPLHPLVSFVDLKTVVPHQEADGEQLYKLGFYSILFKSFQGALRYGRTNYDFEEGTLMFTAPHQVISGGYEARFDDGWALFFHPGLLVHSSLGKTIQGYSFFYYAANEALHISEAEKQIVRSSAENIRREYEGRLDNHSRHLILSNIGLLLDYCSRFYERQFLTRTAPVHDVIQRFEQLLRTYFSDKAGLSGLPEVGYFATELGLSTNYLTDLLKRHTGKTTLEHIHIQLVEKAKSLLWGTTFSISEIAYDLGFNYPSHFTKLFKTQTGLSPKAYRNSSN